MEAEEREEARAEIAGEGSEGEAKNKASKNKRAKAEPKPVKPVMRKPAKKAAKKKPVEKDAAGNAPKKPPKKPPKEAPKDEGTSAPPQDKMAVDDDPFVAARKKVKSAVPAIVDKLVERAKEGSCTHAKTLLEMTGARHMFDGEMEAAGQGESWAKLVLERLDESEAEVPAAAE